MNRKAATLVLAAVAALAAGCMVPGAYVSGGVGVAGGRGYIGGGIGGYYPYGYDNSPYRYPYGYRGYGNYGYGGYRSYGSYGSYGYRGVAPYGRSYGGVPYYRVPDARWIGGYGGYRSAYPAYRHPGYIGIPRRHPSGDVHRGPWSGPGVRPMPGTGVTAPAVPSLTPTPPVQRPSVEGRRHPVQKNVAPYEALEP